MPTSFPKSLLIVGSGAIGIEFASFYRSRSAPRSTVVEATAPHPSRPRTPRSPSSRARPSPGKASPSTPARASSGSPRAATASPPRCAKADGAVAEIVAERVILAIGITGNVEGLGLEAAGGRRSTRATSSSTNGAAPAQPASTPSATWSGRPGSRTRQAMRALSAWRKSAGVEGVHPLDKTNIPAAPIARRKSPASG